MSITRSKGHNAKNDGCNRYQIGICGRTGAGKSSLIVILTRLFEVSEGKILLDGLDCAKVPMSRLRKSISIIPQDPVLFSRTVRQNLDPFEQYPNEVQ